jgi:hypothetical protein
MIHGLLMNIKNMCFQEHVNTICHPIILLIWKPFR